MTSLVSWDRVARETRPQTGPLRPRSPKHRTAQFSSAQRSSCYVFLEAWLQRSKPTYRARLVREAHVTLLKLLRWSNKCALSVILYMNKDPLFLSVTTRELCPVICFQGVCVFLLVFNSQHFVGSEIRWLAEATRTHFHKTSALDSQMRLVSVFLSPSILLRVR